MEQERTDHEGLRPPEAALLSGILARLDRPVVLVGMMGVGKSSLGKRLAQQLGTVFVDADDEIEKAANMSIPAMFERFGEGYFRDGERRVIARLLGEGEGADVVPGTIKVIATGGGAFVNDGTRALILRRSVAVWLDAELETLYDRTARKGNRPLLRQGDPREILRRLKAEREPFYTQAPIHVMSGNTPHSRTLGRILVQLDTWLDHNLKA
jgi:shikimate kinase